MKVAGFSSEEERRRFYGEEDLPPPPEEIEFGRDWRERSDPAAVYALRWVKDTREIYVRRRPRPRSPVDEDPDSPSSPPLAVANMDFGVEVLGWAESLEALQAALEGWELEMPADDSLQWVRRRLAEAAAETERRRPPRPAGWWQAVHGRTGVPPRRERDGATAESIWRLITGSGDWDQRP